MLHVSTWDERVFSPQNGMDKELPFFCKWEEGRDEGAAW